MDPRRNLLRNGWLTLVASLALATLLALPGRAGAANYTMVGSPTDPAATGYSLLWGSTLYPPGSGFTLPALSSFTDNWSFTVASASTFQVQSLLDWGSFGFSSLSASLLTGALAPTGYGNSGPLSLQNLSPSAFLAPGAYNLQISGTTTNAAYAWYGGQLNLVSSSTVSAPIPEPETYAMMLAGLGLMGFVARRRRQKEAA